MRGWGANRAAFEKTAKLSLSDQIKSLDDLTGSVGLDTSGWVHHYELKDALMDIHRLEDKFWR